MVEKVPHVSSSKRLRLAGVIFVIVAVSVVILGIFSRTSHDHELNKDVAQQHTTVKVITPQLGPSDQSLILPGSVRAFIDAPIYARVGGYLKTWNADIGAHVRQGQLLGEIETPELDEQIARAQANMATAESSSELAEVTAKRWENLLVTNSVSRQEADEKTADAKGKKDVLNAARSALKGLQAEQSFKRVIAPFDGVVTERNTDIGQLISANNNNGKPLFRVVKNDKLRVFVEVPQSYAAMIKVGMKVEVSLPEQAGKNYNAAVIAVSQAIHESSRTTTIELLMNNQSNQVMSGSYAEVHFNLPSQTNVYRVPASALLFRKNGLEVATVDANNRVVLKPITIARDLGRVVEVNDGIEKTDQIIDSPSDSITQGDVVQIKKPDAAPTTGAKSGAGS